MPQAMMWWDIIIIACCRTAQAHLAAAPAAGEHGGLNRGEQQMVPPESYPELWAFEPGDGSKIPQ
jgi:hypothetical protein